MRIAPTLQRVNADSDAADRYHGRRIYGGPRRDSEYNVVAALAGPDDWAILAPSDAVLRDCGPVEIERIAGAMLSRAGRLPRWEVAP